MLSTLYMTVINGIFFVLMAYDFVSDVAAKNLQV